MEHTGLIAYIPSINLQTITTSCQDMQMMKDTQQQDAGTRTDLQTRSMFVVWLLALCTILLECVGAYCYPIVYLTVPTNFNPANTLHAALNRTPKVGLAFNSNNRWLFQLLARVVEKQQREHVQKATSPQMSTR